MPSHTAHSSSALLTCRPPENAKRTIALDRKRILESRSALLPYLWEQGPNVACELRTHDSNVVRVVRNRAAKGIFRLEGLLWGNGSSRIVNVVVSGKHGMFAG